MITYTCEYKPCGKIFLGFPSKFRHHCSRKCSALNRIPSKGWHHTEASKEKLRKVQTGRKHTPEHRAKMVKTLIERYGIRWGDEIARRRMATMKKRGFPRKMETSPNWKGGRIKVHGGYIKVMSPEHPHRDKIGYVLEHRLVMENSLGRILDRNEWVHHRNGIRDDNRLENLQVVSHAKPHGEVSCPKCSHVFSVH